MTDMSVSNIVIRKGRRVRTIDGGLIVGITRLTDRQRQVIACRCERDMSNAEIGYELGRSEQTIKNHITVILARVGAVTMHSVCVAWGRLQERQLATRLASDAVRAEDV